ncbi:MAG: site-2 protease family protein [Planctomycetes bacterium]|nr:site-2 protease family protein [Planctomycetota bacterium]
MSPDLDQKLTMLPWLIGALIMSSCVHEAGHAWVAWRLGDRRPDIEAKKTPFTFRHISFWFTILVPSLLFLYAGIMLGGAKPVMVRTAIGAPKMGLVALAGPVGNVFFAAISVAVVVGLQHAGVLTTYYAGDPQYRGALYAVALSVILACLNLIPLPPFDGSRIVAVFLPEPLRRLYYRLTWPVLIAFVLFTLLSATAAPDWLMRFNQQVLHDVHAVVMAVHDWIEA